MSCPIKDENGELDPDALRDLTTIGGHLVEGGIRSYHDWASAMKSKVGDVFNNGDLRTIWMNVKADAAERTGFAQTMTEEDSFVEALTRRLGSRRRAADFANDLVGPGGDTSIMDKIVGEKPLTAAEAAKVDQAWKDNILDRKPRGKAEGPMAIIQKALDDSKPSPRSSPRDPNNGVNGPKTVSGTAGPGGKGGNLTGKGSRTPQSGGLKEDLSEGRYAAGTDENPSSNFERRQQEPPSTSTDEEAFDRFMATKLGGKAAAAAFRADVGEDVYAKLVGDEPLSEVEQHQVAQGVRDRAVSRDNSAAPAETGGRATVSDIVKDVRQEWADDRAADLATGELRSEEPYQVLPTQETPSGLPDDEAFDREMAHQLGGRDAAEAFRGALDPDVYDKLVAQGPKSLTPEETDAVTRAFADSTKARAARTTSNVAQALAPIAKEARAQLAHEADQARLSTFEGAKGLVREQLAKVLPEKRMPAVDEALKSVQDGDHKGLANVFNRMAPRGFLRTNRLWVQGAMLSNPASLAVALYSHLLSAGVENTVAKSIASRMSGGLHASVDPQMLAHAIATSFKHGVPEGVQMFKHGETAETLAGRNHLREPGSDLHQEFTVGNGGKVGNAISAVGRAGGRMHGAVWHAVSTGLDEIARQDAAHYAAIDEMEARGEKWTPEQRRARARELYENPNQKVLDTARELREEQTFQNPNLMADALKLKGKKGAVARIAQDLAAPIVPFAKVASNITGRGLEHTPIGAAVSAVVRVADFADKQNLELRSLSDFRDVVRQMPAAERARLYRIAARGIIGVGVGAAGYYGYKKGVVNAPSPGRGEYGSINGPGGQKWEVGRALGPYAAPLFLGADIERSKEEGRGGMPTMKDLQESFAENPMANVSETLGSIGEPASGRGKPSGAMKFTGSLVGAEIPSFLRSVAGVTDSGKGHPTAFVGPDGKLAVDPEHIMRDKNSDQFTAYLWNTVKSAVPGLRETLPIKRAKGTGVIPDASTLYPVPRHVPEQTRAQLAQARGKDAYFAKKGK